MLSVSDIVMGVEGDSVGWRHGAELTPIATRDEFDRRSPLHLYFQLRADSALPEVRIAIRIFRGSRLGDDVALSIATTNMLTRGVNEIAQTVDISRLARGEYWAEVRASSSGTVSGAGRSIHFRIR